MRLASYELGVFYAPTGEYDVYRDRPRPDIAQVSEGTIILVKLIYHRKQ